MHHICVTGIIGSGKSYITKLFGRLGYARFDADKIVHHLLERDKAVFDKIEKLCPDAILNGAISRQALSHHVFTHPLKLIALEAILHPRVAEAREQFTSFMVRQGRKCVFEIPLYFEAGLHYPSSKIIVTTAPAFLIRQRVLARPFMTVEKLNKILHRQWSDKQKRKKADFIVHTGLSKGYSWEQVSKINLKLGS